MAKPLLGGSAAMLALLSASLILYAQPSVAESLAQAPPESQQQKGDFATGATKAPVEVANTPADISAKIDASDFERAVEETAPVSLGEAKRAGLPVDNPTPAGPATSYVATAYSLRGRTASGRSVTRGLIAADRRVLPIGTRVRLEAGAYSGEYLVADTGGAVRGRKIDIWMPSTREAMRFGRRPIKLTVLTHVRPARRAKASQPAK